MQQRSLPRLRQLQQQLQSHLLNGDSAIAAAIVDAPPLPTLERLGIYRNAYRVRLIEALDDTYPVLHAVLGDEVFVARAGHCGGPSIRASLDSLVRRWLAEF